MEKIRENVGVKQKPPPRSRNSPGRQLKIAAGSGTEILLLSEAHGFLGALRPRVPISLNDSLDIVVKRKRLSRRERPDQFPGFGEDHSEKMRRSLSHRTPQSRNGSSHPGPQDPRPRSLSEGFDLDPRLLRGTSPVRTEGSPSSPDRPAEDVLRMAFCPPCR